MLIKNKTMGTIFAPTYTNLNIGYHKTKVYSIIRQSYALSSKNFGKKCLVQIFRRISNVTESKFDKTRSFTFNIKSN